MRRVAVRMRFGQRRKLLLIAPGHQDLGAGAEQPLGESAADAARASRNENDGLCYVHHTLRLGAYPPSRQATRPDRVSSP